MTVRFVRSSSQIVARRNDEHSGDRPAVVRPEVCSVTGQKMCGPGGHRREEDQLIVGRQYQPRRENRSDRRRHDFAFADERIQAPTLIAIVSREALARRHSTTRPESERYAAENRTFASRKTRSTGRDWRQRRRGRW